jgi:hypothetical protein
MIPPIPIDLQRRPLRPPRPRWRPPATELLNLLLLVLLGACAGGVAAEAHARPSAGATVADEPGVQALPGGARGVAAAAFPSPLALRLTFAPVPAAVQQPNSTAQRAFAARVRGAAAGSLGMRRNGGGGGGGSGSGGGGGGGSELDLTRVEVFGVAAMSPAGGGGGRDSSAGRSTNGSSNSPSMSSSSGGASNISSNRGGGGSAGQRNGTQAGDGDTHAARPGSPRPSGPGLAVDVLLLLAPSTPRAALELLKLQAGAAPALLVQDDPALAALIRGAEPLPLSAARAAAAAAAAVSAGRPPAEGARSAAAALAGWDGAGASAAKAGGGGKGGGWRSPLGNELGGLSFTAQVLIVAFASLMGALVAWRVSARVLRALRDRQRRAAAAVDAAAAAAAAAVEGDSGGRPPGPQGEEQARLTLWAVV